MYAPAEHDEATTLVRFADQQLAAIRASLLGLTEEQARSTPCRSALSPAGIAKHVTRVMSQTAATLTAGPDVATELDFAAHEASFVLREDETTAGVRAQLDAVHQIEELARHAGHAAIIREQIDGVAVPTLVMTEEGAPPNDYFVPYVPAAGTLEA